MRAPAGARSIARRLGRDRCGTVQQRQQFAKLLFSRVTIEGNPRLRGRALNNPFQQLFEFAQPGPKLVLSGVPHRTSYELHLPAELGAWYSLRSSGGRSADARRTPVWFDGTSVRLGLHRNMSWSMWSTSCCAAASQYPSLSSCWNIAEGSG